MIRVAIPRWTLSALLALMASPAPAASGPAPRPLAGYASHLLQAGSGPVPDLVLRRSADGRLRRFAFRPDGRRDIGAITAFLSGGTGRVERVFDQFGHHDLVPFPGTVGPLVVVEPDDRAGPGLRFDNGGGFEGVRGGPRRPYYAVSLSTPLPALGLASGLSVVATLRLADVASIDGGVLWSFGWPGAPWPLLFTAGDPDPTRPEAIADDLFVFLARATDLGPSPPVSPSVFGVSVDASGATAILDGTVHVEQASRPAAARWNALTLGVTHPGSGQGFELGDFLVFDHALSASALREWSARLHPARVARAGTLILDGSSVEAGVGSTALRNLAWRYADALPGFVVRDVAVGGAGIAARLRALPGTTALFADAPQPRVLLCGIGANSLATGLSPDAAYAQITAYVSAARQAVPGLIVGLATLIPNGWALDIGRGDAFASYNRLVRANAAGADFVSDRAADPVLGDPHRFRPIDPTVSADGAHPTDAGHARLAAIDLAALRTALAWRRNGADQAAPAQIRR